MGKLLFAILLLLLAVPLLGGSEELQCKSDGRMRKFAPHRQGNLPPSVRKCLNVKCQEGSYCFHGRCIKLDTSCTTVKCSKGFRCINGKCVQRKHQAKKMICPPVNFQHKKERCTKEIEENCRRNRGVCQAQNVCGFNPWRKEYQDFSNICDACTDRRIKVKFFYPVPCVNAPRICEDDQECMNGVCTDIFKDPAFDNNESCNQNSECDTHEYCAGHKCIDKRDLYDYLESTSETKSIYVRMG